MSHAALLATVYLRNNKKRACVLMVSIGLFITLIYGLRFIFGATSQTFHNLLVDHYEAQATITCIEDLSPDERSNQLHLLSDELSQMDEVDAAFPGSSLSGAAIYSVIGEYHYSAAMMEQSDLMTYLNHFNATLTDGNLPSVPGELVIDERFAQNSGLAVGDELQKGYPISGIVSCDTYIAAGIIKDMYDISCYVLLHDDSKTMEQLLKEVTVPFEYTLTSHSTGTIEFDENVTSSMDFSARLITIASAAVLFLCLVVIMQMYYRDRKEEWCLYHSIGYSLHNIYLLAMRELLLCMGGAILISILASVLFMGIMQAAVIVPKGLFSTFIMPDVIFEIISVLILFIGVCQIPLVYSMNQITTIDILDEDAN